MLEPEVSRLVLSDNRMGIELNAGQAQAEIEIDESIAERRHHLLSGHAGSGKTTLLQAIAARYHFSRRNIVLSAPTHQACAVLRGKMRAAGINVTVVTVAVLLGLRPVPKGDRLTFVRDPWAEAIKADTVVIDEASMVGDELMDLIDRWLAGRAVIFSGDPAQLFPVGEEESSTFQTENRSHLSEPVRQALGNPILEAAWAIRKAQDGELDWSWVKPAHDATHGVYIPNDPELWMRKAFTSDAFAEDSNRHRYLCWTNARVAQVNAMVREWRYGPTETPFVPGEKALIRAPLIQEETIVLHTNEEVTVKEIRGSHHLGLETWRMAVETEAGTIVEAHMPRAGDDYQRKLSFLADEARSGRKSWRAFHDFKAHLITAQSNYAGTVHTAQGITTRNAFVDMPEMRRWVRGNQAEGLRGLYVACTRPSHSLTLVGA